MFFHNFMDFPQYVYILKCADSHTYTGSTNDLDDRMARHGKGMVVATKNSLPVDCIVAFGLKDEYKAYKFEKYLKTGSGRVFIGRHLV